MNTLLRRSKLFCNKNASTILTCIGGAGVIITSALAIKATPKAMELIKRAEEEKEEKLTKLETVINAAPAYIPTAIAGVTTIACIFSANVLNKKRQAAITSAYALLDNSYKEYRKKVDELYGEEAGQRVRANIAKDEYEENKVEVEVEDDKRLFYDFFSDRYFTANPVTIAQAESHINRNITLRDCAYLNDFYEEVGLEPIEAGWELGWSTSSCFDVYWVNWVDLAYETVTLDDNLKCTIIRFKQEPIPGFEDYC